MTIHNAKKIFIIGIKGAGTSALAHILTEKGVSMTGSDVAEHYYTDTLLKRLAISVRPFGTQKTFKDFDLVIYSTAYSDTNPDLVRAQKEGIPLMSYPEALGALTTSYTTSIAVAGSHGKSTITSLLALTLEAGGLNPTALVGAEVNNWGTSARPGGEDYFVFEADEYQDKFQHYRPKIIILNNINFEHPDFFSDMSAYTKAFQDFILSLPDDGTIIANYDHRVVREIVYNSDKPVIWYGTNKAADFRLVKRTPMKGFQELRVVHENKEQVFQLSLIGEHNALNALPVVALSDLLGIHYTAVTQSFSSFKGTKRRLEFIHTKKDYIIIDDYAHHPAEIRASIAALKEAHPHRRIVCIFQPHTFTRTKALLSDFASAFRGVDDLVLISIFGSAREKHGGVTIEDLKTVISKHNSKISTVNDTAEALAYLHKHTQAGDLVVTMGAGDTWKVAESFK